ncbi:MAG: hypothetical protein JSU91_01880 [Thermoplasmatales archaeon]|nr:MAG: hypothetical protein JSU91_01880 [Thermoplasmatales archaeon]
MGEQISLPKTTLNILGASQRVANTDQKILFLGQKTASGSATSGELNEDVSTAEIASLFGRDSLIAQELRAFKTINDKSQVDVIALDDNGAGVAATGQFVISGTATEAGTITFDIGSSENNSYEVAVASGDTATDIGDALDVLTAADLDAPFTTSNSAGTITVTAKNKGTIANKIGLRASGTIAGITKSVVAMNGGVTDPTLTDVFTPIDGVRYQTIVYPAYYAISTIKTLMSARWNVDNKVLDGVAILTNTDSKADLVSAYTSENNQQIVVIGNKEVSDTAYKGSAIFELDGVISAQFAAIRSLRLTPNVSIASLTIAGTNGARDSFGGDAIRSLPYFNTPMTSLPIIPTGKGFTDSEVSDLNTAGVSVIGNNISRSSIIIGEMVTTYKTDAASNTDTSFKYLNFVDTISGIREYYFNNLKSRFAQSRLTTGAILPRRSMANEQVITGYCIKLYGDLSGEDFVLTQAGETALTFYKDNLSVTINLAGRSVALTMQTPIVTQLANITGSVQLSFTTA